MKKLIYNMGYIFCNRIVLGYGLFVALLWFAANIKSFDFNNAFVILGAAIIAIVGWSAYLVCDLPHINPNKWERPLIDWFKRMTQE